MRSTWSIVAAFESSESQGSRRSKDSRSGLTLAAFLRPADVPCNVSALLRGIFIHAAAHATILACVHPRWRKKRRRFAISRASGSDKGRRGRARQGRGEARRTGPNRNAGTGGTPHQVHNRRRRNRYVGSFDDDSHRRGHVTPRTSNARAIDGGSVRRRGNCYV